MRREGTPAPDPPAETGPEGVFHGALRGFRNHRPETVLFVLVILLSAYLRFTYAAEAVIDNPIRADAFVYFTEASNLVRHGVYSSQNVDDPKPDSVYPPALPFLMAAVILATDSVQSFVKWMTFIHALIGTFTVVAFYFLARQWLPWGVALAGTFLVGTNPHLVTLGGYLLSETLFTAFLVLSFLLVSLALRRGDRLSFFLTGVACALALLTRPVFIFVPPALFVLFALKNRPLNRAGLSRSALPYLLGFTLLYGPWVVRNLVATHEVETSQRALHTATMGIYPELIHRDPRLQGYPYRDDPRFEQISASLSSFTAELRRRFAAEPGRYLYWYTIGKARMLWRWSILVGMGDIYVYPIIRSPYSGNAVFRATYMAWKALYPLLLWVGVLVIPWYLFRSTFRRLDFLPNYIVIFLGIMMVFHAITVGLPRHAIPLRPFLVFVGLWFAVDVFRFAAKRPD